MALGLLPRVGGRWLGCLGACDSWETACLRLEWGCLGEPVGQSPAPSCSPSAPLGTVGGVGGPSRVRSLWGRGPGHPEAKPTLLSCS